MLRVAYLDVIQVRPCCVVVVPTVNNNDITFSPKQRRYIGHCRGTVSKCNGYTPWELCCPAWQIFRRLMPSVTLMPTRIPTRIVEFQTSTYGNQHQTISHEVGSLQATTPAFDMARPVKTDTNMCSGARMFYTKCHTH